MDKLFWLEEQVSAFQFSVGMGVDRRMSEYI